MATIVGPIVGRKTTDVDVGAKSDSLTNHNNNVNCPSPGAPGDHTGQTTETMATNTIRSSNNINMARHDNRNNNNQSMPIDSIGNEESLESEQRAEGNGSVGRVEEECNRINNNHLAEGAIAPPPSVASRASSHRTSASSAIFDEEPITTDNDTSTTHTTASDTVDQRLPVYV